MVRKRKLALGAVALLSAMALVGSMAPASADGHWGSQVPDELNVCADDHPAVVQLTEDVAYSIKYLYPDMPTMLARGYIPYFDIAFFGPAGMVTNGMTHWLNPREIDNGHMLDPFRPESLLTDEWGRPMGIMFIASEGMHPGPPLAKDDDGEDCYPPWHPHYDLPARFSWWFYLNVYRGEPGLIPERTPEMFHIFPNHPGGIYSHGGPPHSHREGPPEPIGEGPPLIGVVPPGSQEPQEGSDEE